MKIKICFFFLLTASTFAQPVTEDIKHFLYTGKNVFTAPLEWDKSDWINFGGTVLFTVGAYAVDTKTEDLALRNKSSFNDALFEADKYYYLPTGAVMMGGLYIYGLAADNKEIRRLGLHLGEAAFYSGVVTTTIKFVTGRSRPFLQKGKKEANLFRTNDAQASFPSGHSTLAFALSTVMANYWDNTIWKISWYTAAGLVGAARIYHDRHWLSDVVFGAAIGHFIADYVVSGSEEKNKVELGVLPGGLYMRVAL